MKATIKIKKEVELKYLKLIVPVEYEDDDMPFNFPFRNGDIWEVEIDIDEGRIINYDHDEDVFLSMKVRDEGKYYLLDSSRDLVLKREEDYVPEFTTGVNYGDYIDFDILKDGTIKNWKKDFSIKGFK